MKSVVVAWAVIVGLAGAAQTRADFAGQPILGPLVNGSSVTGNTAGRADDNDGFESGTHIFDIWDGGDDVWRLDWLGGDLTVVLDSTEPGADNDLFLYTPDSLDSSSDYSIVGAHDEVTLLGAAAGTYYINVDSTFFTEGGYSLSVVPAPTSGVLLVMGAVAIGRRRR